MSYTYLIEESKSLIFSLYFIFCLKGSEKKISSKEANFEEAVAATGYGKFHYLLYLVIIPASWASGFDTSTTSMIAPSAECDLNLTLFQKGILNAIVYAGKNKLCLLKCKSYYIYIYIYTMRNVLLILKMHLV